MKKFKITFGKIEPITGKNYYQIVNAYGARQLGNNHVELLVENFLVVALLYYSSGVVSVEEQKLPTVPSKVNFMANYRQFCVTCPCGALTSRVYARAHAGQCKRCVTGVAPIPSKAPAPPKENFRDLCPDCGERTLTAYQKRNGYHCDGCTREADPIGAYNEMMGYNDNQGEY